MKICIANLPADIRECFPVIKELRPHLEENKFVEQVQRQMKNHAYELLFIRDNNKIVAVAGYRLTECLAWGKFLYVDDLVTLDTSRQSGYAGKLMDWLITRAKELSCQQVHLDSGAHRHAAHRLYLNKKLQISSLHFSNETDNL